MLKTKQRVLVNVSNHPSDNFTKEQKSYNLREYDQIYDVAFPLIEQKDNDDSLYQKSIVTSNVVFEILYTLMGRRNEIMHADIMVCGEFGVTYLIVQGLKDRLPDFFANAVREFDCMVGTNPSWRVVYPSSERVVVELENGKSVHKFNFYGYRRYLDV